jgi:hypothetical protein
VVAIFSRSHSTPCIINMVKTDLDLVVTYLCTETFIGSSPSSFGARASIMPAIVALVESGTTMSLTCSSVDCTFVSKLQSSRHM